MMNWKKKTGEFDNIISVYEFRAIKWLFELTVRCRNGIMEKSKNDSSIKAWSTIVHVDGTQEAGKPGG